MQAREAKENALGSAASAYLRSARHQPVEWMEWGEEAFRRARAEDKPILLDIGAVWCHWCHVMDRESYESPAVAAVINRHYIPVKVDRDERPDIDARYQAAVGAMAGQGGWPLTAILTGEGRPFFGGTYFPPEDRAGKPGLKRVLETMAGVWRERRREILETAASVVEAIEQGETFGEEGELGPGLIDAIVSSALESFDPRHGGFGDQPKFPHPAAMDLLIDVAARTGNADVRRVVEKTLDAMRAGGVYDQLAGGFHRYSVDERWVVPHFEKMLYDNAGLLANYAHAAEALGDERWARVTAEMVGWMDRVLSDRERGGFYASQDADVGPDDDGDYWTWTRAEAAAVLTPEELAVAGEYWDIGELGDMHHNPAKNVLHVAGALEGVAARAGVDLARAQELIESARGKLLAAREARPRPFVDRAVYTGWNALAVSAHLAASRVLRMDEVRGFALQTLDRLLSEGWRDGELRHVMAYAEGGDKYVPGVLEDYASLLHACLDAWEATGELRYFEQALALGEALMERFADREEGGFFDTVTDGEALGVLGTRRKPLQDAPTPAGNPHAAAGLLRLYALTDRDEFREAAGDALELFAGVVEHLGLYAGSYGMALERWLLGPVQVVVVGEDEAARALAEAARVPWAVNKSVVRLRREQVAAGALPPALAETLPALSGRGGSFALVCRANVCLPPVTYAEQLREQLAGRVIA